VNFIWGITGLQSDIPSGRQVPQVSGQSNRAPSLGEIHQELEKEAQVVCEKYKLLPMHAGLLMNAWNRLLQMIRSQQLQLQQMQQQ
jgi:hypothetical protein